MRKNATYIQLRGVGWLAGWAGLFWSFCCDERAWVDVRLFARDKVELFLRF